MNWFAIHTKPREERVAQLSFEREGIETLYPRVRQKKLYRRKYQWITGPLFPRYIFALFDYTKSGRLARYARGVTNIVSFHGKPAIVDESIIEEIRSRSKDSLVTIEPPSLRPGDRVEIQEGPFRGLQGVFERNLSGAERVVILLQNLAANARVEMSRSQLEKIS